jgi:hypothetical protein
VLSYKPIKKSGAVQSQGKDISVRTLRRITFLTLSLFFFFSFSCLAEEPFLFRQVAVYTDSQSKDGVHRGIVGAIMKIEPRVVFHAGDLVDDGNSLSDWVTFDDIIGPLRASAQFYPALGNHERNAPFFYANFELPNNERWYSVDVNGIHFIVLDSNAPLHKGAEQYSWLKNDLERSQAETQFTAVIFHHPLFTSSLHEADEKKFGKDVIPLFERYGVDLVLSGHNHSYERFFYNGIYYLVIGSSGGDLRDESSRPPYRQVFIKKHCFAALSVLDGRILVEIFDRDLNTLDQFEITSQERRESQNTALSVKTR